MKEDITAAEKLRNIANWLDYQDENFNDRMTSIQMIEQVYDACNECDLEFADDLDWEDEDDEEFKLAKKINEIFGYPYYILHQPDFEFYIPEWALNYMVNGTSDNLNEEEITVADAWMKETFPNGFTMEVDWHNCKELDFWPAFGTRNPNAITDRGESPFQGCKTYNCLFYNAKQQ